MKRRLLRSVARWLAGVLLLAQLAIASYACPGVAAALALGTPLPAASVAQQPGASQPGSNAMAAAMPDCSEMAGAPDPGSANLCAEHCKYGQQSDQTPTLVVPAVSLMVLYTTAPAPTLALPRAATATLEARLAAPPPHAILHCVFRV